MKFVDNGFPDTFVLGTPIGLDPLTCQAVINKLHKALRNLLSKGDIERSLLASFLKTEAKEWLHFVLTLFYSDADNLCTLFDLTTTTVHQRGNIMPGCSEHRGRQTKHHASGG